MPKGKYINHGARMTLLASRGFIADDWARLECEYCGLPCAQIGRNDR